MPAIRIIDDHIELASIGTNTHAQIDTHIADADNYVKRDGSLSLTSDWDIGDTRKIHTDEIRARDAAGLKLYDDGGNGIFVKDGGNVGIGTDAPGKKLQIKGDSAAILLSSGSYTNIRLEPKGDSGVDLDTGVLRLDYQGNTKIFLDAGSEDSYFNNGNVGIGTTTPTAKLDVNSDILRLRTAKTPATAGAAGNQGDICWDADFIYICTATNSWERAAIAAW